MNSTRDTSTKIALNVTRTRVTVLGFNLTITVFMLSMMAARGTAAESCLCLDGRDRHGIDNIRNKTTAGQVIDRLIQPLQDRPNGHGAR